MGGYEFCPNRNAAGDRTSDLVLEQQQECDSRSDAAARIITRCEGTSPGTEARQLKPPGVTKQDKMWIQPSLESFWSHSTRDQIARRTV